MMPAATPRHLTLVLFALCALALACTSKSDASLRALETRVVRLEQAGSGGGAATAVGKVVTFKEFGFSLPLPEGAEVKSGGLSGGRPGKDEGQMSAVAGGVTMAMVWTKQAIPPKDAVQGGLQVLVGAQPGLQFRAINQGDMKVDGQAASFGAFGA